MKLKIKLILLIFFVVFIIAGVYLGEAKLVLKKAISICLSCIGIS